MNLSPAFLTSTDQTWTTPDLFLEKLASEENLRFVIDAAASAASAKCDAFYSEEDSAFSHDWAMDLLAAAGEDPKPISAEDLKRYQEQRNMPGAIVRVREPSPTPAIWCNPPYGDPNHPVSAWFQAGIEAGLDGATVAFLLPCNKRDQDWFHDLACRYAKDRPVRGRIRFTNPQGEIPLRWDDEKQIWVPQTSNSQGSMILLVGPKYAPCAQQSFDWKQYVKEAKRAQKEIRAIAA